MTRNVAYFLILGKPLIMYLGILALVSFLATASIAMCPLKKLNVQGLMERKPRFGGQDRSK